jgi:hypothetical protein
MEVAVIRSTAFGCVAAFALALAGCGKGESGAAVEPASSDTDGLAVEGKTAAELWAEKDRTVEEAARVVKSDERRYMALMSEKIPAINKRLDDLVRAHCGDFARLSDEVNAAKSEAAKLRVVERWKGKEICVIAAPGHARDRGRLPPPQRELLEGKVSHVVDLETAGSVSPGPVRIAVVGELGDDLRAGKGPAKLTGKVLGGWADAPKEPLCVYLSRVRSDPAP